MILVDLNILIYAVNSDAIHHERVRKWWEATLSGDRPVALCWQVLLGFLRLSTRPHIFERPLPAESALAYVDHWLMQPQFQLLEPTQRHWQILSDLLATSGVAGNLTTDAHLAALAIEHGAVLASCDADFSRFVGLRWQNPLAE